MSRWTDEQVETLTRLWSDGLSAAQIVCRLEELDFRPSRNAVIGKVHRLKLPPRYVVPKRARIAKRILPRTRDNGGGIATNIARNVGKAFAVVKPIPRRLLEPPKPPECAPVTLMERTARQCCWPVGEANGPDTLMCGAPKEIEHSYCRWHQEMAVREPGRPWTDSQREKYMRTRFGTRRAA